MNIRYALFYAGGNVTALIETAVVEDKRVEVANTLLAAPELANELMEQVGFVDRSERDPNVYRMRIAGGSLCINAARSLAAYVAGREQIESFPIEISGYTGGFISAIAKPDGLNTHDVSLELRLDLLLEDPIIKSYPISLFGCELEVQVVNLMGITHVITPYECFNETLREIFLKENAGKNEQKMPELNTVFEQLYAALPFLAETSACGLIAIEVTTERMVMIRPIVKVNSQGTLFYETSCGSGSIAVALAYLTEPREGQVVDLVQPTGATIKISFSDQDIPGIVRVEGLVELTKSSSINLFE